MVADPPKTSEQIIKEYVTTVQADGRLLLRFCRLYPLPGAAEPVVRAFRRFF